MAQGIAQLPEESARRRVLHYGPDGRIPGLPTFVVIYLDPDFLLFRRRDCAGDAGRAFKGSETAA